MTFDIDAAIDDAAHRLERRKGEDERQKKLATLKRELHQDAHDLKRMVRQFRTDLEWSIGPDATRDTCGLFAAQECWRQFKADVPARVLSFTYPQGHRFAGEAHAVTCYETPDNVVFVYEPGNGSLCLGRTGWDAQRVAQAVCKGATGAQWLTKFA